MANNVQVLDMKHLCDQKKLVKEQSSSAPSGSVEKPWKTIKIESGNDLISAQHNPPITKVVVFGIFAIQIMTLIATIVVAKGAELQPYNLSIVAIGGIYASVAVIVEGWSEIEGTLHQFFAFVFAVLDIETNAKVRVRPMNFSVVVLQGIVSYLSIAALIITLPPQGSVINIVLNATAVICVAKLDDSVFEKFEFHIEVLESYEREKPILDLERKEDELLALFCKKGLPVIAGCAFYAGLLLLTWNWNRQCSSDPNCN